MLDVDMLAEEDMLFVYSDMQYNEDVRIQRSIGMAFVLGDVSVGSDIKKFSKVIREKDLNAMVLQYPDTKIIYKGKLSTTSFHPIRKTSVKNFTTLL